MQWFSTWFLIRMPGTLRKNIPNTRPYPSQSLGEWDPGIGIFLSIPGDSNVQSRWMATAPEAGNYHQQVPQPIHPERKGHLLGVVASR